MKRAILIGAIMGALMIPSIAGASNDNVGYEFQIQAYQGNSVSAGRYRESYTVKDPWKVDMLESTEGQGNTTTNYWLELNNGKNVTPTVAVDLYDGPLYNQTSSAANRETVRLAAENNNYNSNSYRVKGIWDEETW